MGNTSFHSKIKFRMISGTTLFTNSIHLSSCCTIPPPLLNSYKFSFYKEDLSFTLLFIIFLLSFPFPCSISSIFSPRIPSIRLLLTLFGGFNILQRSLLLETGHPQEVNPEKGAQISIGCSRNEGQSPAELGSPNQNPFKASLLNHAS